MIITVKLVNITIFSHNYNLGDNTEDLLTTLKNIIQYC